MNSTDAPLLKIDPQGHYALFPGMTVIGMIRHEDKPFWRQVHSAIAKDKLLMRYFSPLPLDSYHMTALNLVTQAQDGGDDWPGFLRENRPLFQRLAASLDALRLMPALSIDTVVVSDVIQLHGHLPTPQHQAIVTLARQYHLEHKIPRVFHVTLAYRYQSPPAERVESITQAVSERLQTLLQHYGSTWSLQAAGLCYFDDMTAFIPWENKVLHQ